MLYVVAVFPPLRQATAKHNHWDDWMSKTVETQEQRYGCVDLHVWFVHFDGDYSSTEETEVVLAHILINISVWDYRRTKQEIWSL